MASLYSDPDRLSAFKNVNYFRILERHFLLWWKYDEDGDKREETKSFPIYGGTEFVQGSPAQYVRVNVRPVEAYRASMGPNATSEYRSDIEVATTIDKAAGDILSDLANYLTGEFLEKYQMSPSIFTNLVLTLLSDENEVKNAAIIRDITRDFMLEDGGGMTALEKARKLLEADFQVCETDERQIYQVTPSDENGLTKGIVIVQPVMIQF